MRVGSYVGDGASGRVVKALGFEPGYVIVIGEGATPAVERYAPQGRGLSLALGTDAEKPDRILDFHADGFEIGADAAVNERGVTYHYAAWRAGSDRAAVGSYVGDRGSSRTIEGLGFEPEVVQVSRRQRGSAPVVHAPAAAANATLPLDAGLPFPGGIETAPGGFVVGRDARVNARGREYYWVAFRGPAASGLPSADLAISKSVSDARPNEADVITYTIEVTNLGPDDATGVEVTDVLPAEVTHQSDAATQGDYDPGSGIWAVGSVPNGATHTLTIEVTVDSTVVNPGHSESIANTASVTASDAEDGNAANDSDTAGLVLQAADLEIAKSVDVPEPNEGESVTYSVVLTNHGPDAATAVTVLDLLPDGVTFTSGNATQGSYAPGTGIWDVGTVPDAESRTLTITATIDAGSGGSSVVNTASVLAADQADPDPSNDADSVRVEPQAADLAIDKEVDDSAPFEGDTITFTVTVTNLGPNAATNVEVTDVLPAGLFLQSSVTTAGTYDDGTGKWSVGAVAAGASETLTLNADVEAGSAGFAIVNVASVTASDQADPDPANDAGSASLRVGSSGVGEVQITNAPDQDQRPTWSPDGTEIAFDRTAGMSVDLWKVPVLGGFLPTQLTTRSVSDFHPDWSSDGLAIVFAAPQVSSGVTDLWQISPSGGAPVLFAEDAASEDRFPTWSPDRSKIAFNKDSGSGGDIYVIPATGGAPLPITADPANDVHPTWSPDGTQIAFLSSRSGNNDIWIVPATGGAATQITFDAANDGAPDWSPDGTQIAFQSNRSGNNDIWVIPAAGGVAVQVTTDLGVDAQPDWSPAGNQIAFSRNGNIWVHTFADPGDPGITMDVEAGAFVEGGSVEFRVKVVNRGPGFVTGLRVEDSTPPGLLFRSAVASQGGFDLDDGVWNLGSLGSGSSAHLAIQAGIARGTAGETIRNEARLVSLHQEDLDLTNNAASVTIVVTAGLGVPSTGFVPSVHALAMARPNPFRESATIQFDVPNREAAVLSIFDVTGRLVHTLVREELAPGRYAPVWDGRDGGGRIVAPGVYFVRLESGSFTASRRVVRVR
jgi:uncharacterized repeat protein (TIGR01451 family)